MTVGIKSKYFGCIWKNMFITAMTMPDRIDLKNKNHVLKQKRFKQFYGLFKYTIPCKYCRDYTKDVLEKKYPLNFSGRVPLMKSLYIWKKAVSDKLIAQGCDFTKPSPPFEVILARYEKLKARCDKKIGKCV